MTIQHSTRGFTLVELMIAVAIVAILAAIALPSYREQVTRTQRSDGKGYLMELAAAQERHFGQNVEYAADLADLGYADNTSPEGYYSVTIVRPTSSTFILTATPTFSDGECTTLTLTNTNLRGATGTDPDRCWE